MPIGVQDLGPLEVEACLSHLATERDGGRAGNERDFGLGQQPREP